MSTSMSKFEQLKHRFDKITSNHSQNWQLVIFWIIVFEIFATLFEYMFVGNSTAFIIKIQDSIAKEFFIGLYFTVFLWACVYNFIFWNLTNLLWLCLIAITGMYFIITNDLTLNLLLHNLFPVHYLQASFSYIFIIELIFKLIITYLIYQLIRTLKNKNSTPPAS
ncbi:MAG: hypothetical protein WCY75_10805 [Sulfurimonadaceae bacterium]|jgi:hypothetical protein